MKNSPSPGGFTYEYFRVWNHGDLPLYLDVRSLSPGFAGIPNPLFALDNSLMFFGDGKAAFVDMITAMKEL